LEASLHEKYMRRCLELASKGLGKTRSNPMVGAVIVHNEIIIGEGYHHEFGGPHAEVNAINSVKDKSLLKESVMYVNLEPCSHQGKTPPCSLLIREVGIPELIVGCTDPNPLVSGKGLRLLAEKGIELKSNVLERECRFLNRRFYTFHEKKRPYIILKWAETSDGYIDNRDEKKHFLPPLRITGDFAQLLVHKWRTEEMGIMVGTNTANMDNPTLNVRYWEGEDPVRVTFERNSPLRKELKILNDERKTLVYSHSKNLVKGKLEYCFLNEGKTDPDEVMADLYKRNMLSIMVEGGATLFESLLNVGLWDEARVFTGNISAGGGTLAPVINEGEVKIKTMAGADELQILHRIVV
jgi:diaminohydroxyphosphoribosylaminopyrimidine deaminase / 5-amino-6-(5-phosphoribosylamino)uracil reductase